MKIKVIECNGSYWRTDSLQSPMGFMHLLQDLGFNPKMKEVEEDNIPAYRWG